MVKKLLLFEKSIILNAKAGTMQCQIYIHDCALKFKSYCSHPILTQPSVTTSADDLFPPFYL